MCDRLEPWAHGVVAGLSRHPDYYDFNAVRVERPAPDLSAAALAAEADRLQPGLHHRKLEVYDEETGERLRAGFERLGGWHHDGLLWMTMTEPPRPPDAAGAIEDASDEDVRPLRLSWVEPPHTPEAVAAFLPTDEAVGRRLGARNLVLRDAAGAPIAFTRFLLLGDEAEVINVFVAPEHRGRGLGGALTAATAGRAFEAGASVVHIVADAYGRPRELYARLGFRPARVQHDFTRILRFPGE